MTNIISEMPEPHLNGSLPTVVISDRCSHSQEDDIPPKEKRSVRIANLFLKTDLHGLPEIYEGITNHKYAQLIFWTFIVIITAGLLTWQIYECIRDFKEEPIISTYKVHRANLDKANVNGTWSRRYVDGLLDVPNSNLEGAGLLSSLETVSSAFDSVIKPPEKPTGILSLTGGVGWVGRIWEPKNAEDYFLKVGYAKDRFIRECSIGGTFASGENAKCDNLIEEVFDAEFGKCFLISLTESGVIQRKQGRGISLVIDLDFEAAYPELTQLAKRSQQKYRHEQPLFDGVTLRVGSPFDAGAKSTILVAAGTKTNVALERTSLELIQSKPLDAEKLCKSEDDAHQYGALSADLPYSIDSCDLDCVLSNIIGECGCVSPIASAFLQRANNLQYCTVDQMHNCVLNVSRIDAARSELQRCSQQCIVACELDTYKTRVTSVPIPSRRYRNLLLYNEIKAATPPGNSRRPPPADQISPDVSKEDEKNASDTEPAAVPSRGVLWDIIHGKAGGIHGRKKRNSENNDTYSPPLPQDTGAKTYLKRDDIIVLDLFYENLQYVYIEQEHSMTVSTFIGNVGGQVGLWMGASIISLVKIVLVLLPFCMAGKIKRRNAHQNWGRVIGKIIARRRTLDIGNANRTTDSAVCSESTETAPRWQLRNPHEMLGNVRRKLSGNFEPVQRKMSRSFNRGKKSESASQIGAVGPEDIETGLSKL